MQGRTRNGLVAQCKGWAPKPRKRGGPNGGDGTPHKKFVFENVASLSVCGQVGLQGSWLELLAEGASCAKKKNSNTVSPQEASSQQSDDDGKRAARALSLVQMGELSAARQALEPQAQWPL